MEICLVAGGAGFIGSHLVEALIKRGSRVRVLDNFSTGSMENLAGVRHEVEIIFGDLNDTEVLRQAMTGVDLLFQLASSPYEDCESLRTAPRWACPSENLNALAAAREAKVRRVVFASSCSVYGQVASACLAEDGWVRPTTADGFAKLACEMQCLGFTMLFGLESVRLRYADCFGPRQSAANRLAHALAQIVTSMLKGQAPVLEDGGSAVGDFIHVDDVVHATLLAAAMPRVSGQAYNIASGQSLNLLEIVRLVNEIRGTQLRPVCNKQAYSDVNMRSFDIARAEIDLGFCPSISLRQGLQKLIDDCLRPNAPDQAASTATRTGPHFMETRSRPTPLNSGACPLDFESPDG
jgi:UDP-glucose 4-epimerase